MGLVYSDVQICRHYFLQEPTKRSKDCIGFLQSRFLWSGFLVTVVRPRLFRGCVDWWGGSGMHAKQLNNEEKITHCKPRKASPKGRGHAASNNDH